jgi:hypothetical protein
MIPISKNRITVALGVALIMQFLTSLISNAVFFDPLINEDDIGKTMVSLAQNGQQAHIGVFMDFITAVVIVWLAVLFFQLLRNVNQVFAMTALALYVMEAIMLVMRVIFEYALILCSDVYAANGDKALEVFGQVLLHTKDFIGSIEMIPFGIGAVLFYYLLFKSGALPAWIPLWGLITVILIPIFSILGVYGAEISFFLYLPYVPFELFTGAYILIRGLRLPPA